MVSPGNIIQATPYGLNRLYLDICMYMQIHMHAVTIKKEAMNCRSGAGQVGGLRGRKHKREMY